MSQCKCAESDFIVRMRFQFIFSFIAANRMPWRYIVVTTTFAAVLSITAMRYCFSLTLTQMVRAPTLSSNAPIDAQSCPINAATTQSNVSHTIAVAVGRSVDFFSGFHSFEFFGYRCRMTSYNSTGHKSCREWFCPHSILAMHWRIFLAVCWPTGSVAKRSLWRRSSPPV